MCHHAKFCADQSNHSSDMAIFRLSTVSHIVVLKVENCDDFFVLIGPIRINVQNLVPIVHPLLRYSDFWIFQDDGCPQSWIFQRSQF